MTIKRKLIYVNTEGVDLYDVPDSKEAEEFYEELIDKHSDDPEETEAFILTIKDADTMYVEEVYSRLKEDYDDEDEEYMSTLLDLYYPEEDD